MWIHITAWLDSWSFKTLTYHIISSTSVFMISPLREIIEIPNLTDWSLKSLSFLILNWKTVIKNLYIETLVENWWPKPTLFSDFELNLSEPLSLRWRYDSPALHFFCRLLWYKANRAKSPPRDSVSESRRHFHLPCFPTSLTYTPPSLAPPYISYIQALPWENFHKLAPADTQWFPPWSAQSCVWRHLCCYPRCLSLSGSLPPTFFLSFVLVMIRVSKHLSYFPNISTACFISSCFESFPPPPGVLIRPTISAVVHS